MLKSLQARLQQYVNWELSNVQTWFRKVRGTRDQIANIHWIRETARKFQENIISASLTMLKPFDCVDHNKLWKRFKEMGIPNHFSCLLTNLYVGQEATVRTRHGIMDWFKIGKGVCQGCILSPCLIILYAEYIMWNARLDESQAVIKIAGKISATSEYSWYHSNGRKWRGTKELLMRVKEESEKPGLKPWLLVPSPYGK